MGTRGAAEPALAGAVVGPVGGAVSVCPRAAGVLGFLALAAGAQTSIHKGLGMSDAHARGALHGDRLQPLGAHHRAIAALAGGVPRLGLQHRDTREPLARLPARDDAGVGPMHPAQDGGGRIGAFAPKLLSILDLDLAVIDPQVDRLLRLALHHDAVVTGVFQLRAPVTAHARTRKDRRSLLRGDSRHLYTPRARGQRAREGAHHDHQQIRGVKGIRTWCKLVPSDASGHTQSPDQSWGVAHGIDVRDGARGEIYPEDLARPSMDVGHVSVSFPQQAHS